MQMISVMLMTCSVSDKKSPRRGRRVEPQSRDLRRQTRRKHASRTLERLDLSSCYFSQAAQHRYFTKRDISFCMLLAEYTARMLRNLHATFSSFRRWTFHRNVKCLSACHPGVSSKMETRTLSALLLSTVRLAIRAIDLVSETATVQPLWFVLANAR